MNQARKSSSHPFVNTMFAIAVAIAATGAVKHVSYRNQQIQTARDIESTEKNIASLMQDEIPSLQAEIDRQLARYDIREKLKKNGSDLVATPPENIEVIHVNEASSRTVLRP